MARLNQSEELSALFDPYTPPDGLPSWYPRSEDCDDDTVELLDTVGELPAINVAEMFTAMESLLTSVALRKRARR